MKTQLSIIASFLFMSIFSFAQKSESLLHKENIKVWGNCEMCKKRIENAAISAGAITATWDEESKLLAVKYDGAKSSNKKIQEKVAAAGHDTQDAIANDNEYKKLPGCCQYERKATDKNEVAQATSMNCCKDNATCNAECSNTRGKACCKDNITCKDGYSTKDIACCKATTAKESCCKTASNCCGK